MERIELEKALAQGPVAPVWLIQGGETWKVEQAIEAVLLASVGTLEDPLLINRVDLHESKRGVGEVIGACRSLGLFTPKMAVVVRGAERLIGRKADLDALDAYVQSPTPGATLILKANKRLDGRSALVKRIAKVGQILNYPELRSWEAEKWLQQHARQQKIGLDREAALLMVELIGPDLMSLTTSLEQLHLYTDMRRAITRADVEEVLASTRAHSVFELVDAVAAKDMSQAAAKIHAMLEAKTYPGIILGAVTRHFRQLSLAKPLISAGGGPRELEGALGLHPFVAKKLAQQVGRFSAGTLRALMEEIYRTEVRLRVSRIEASVLLDLLFMRLVALQR